MTSYPPFLTSPTLSEHHMIEHAFFTKQGGVSNGYYDSLNCGPGSYDDRDHIAENRSRAMQAINRRADQLCTLAQIHSPDVVTITEPFTNGLSMEGDAMVTNSIDVVLGVLTADCCPILFADPVNRIIGAAHAGWKGALGGIVENTVQHMIKLGANQHHIICTLGPTIGPNSYEVGPEFYEQLIQAHSSNEQFFSDSDRKNYHMFDLPSYIMHRAQSLDLASCTNINRDTLAEPDSFFSYRRNCLAGNNQHYGRLLSVIALTPH